MITEAAFLLTWTACGAAALALAGMRGWALAPLGFVTGTAGVVSLTTILAMIGAPTHPVLVAACLVSVTLGVWLRCGRPLPGSAGLTGIGLSAGAIVAVTIASRLVHMVNLHPDSIRYIQVGSLIHQSATGLLDADLLETRQFAAGALHAPAGVHGEFYIAAVTPLLALVTLAVVGWILSQVLAGSARRSTQVLVSISAVLALVTTNRFVFHGLLVQAHLLHGLMLVTLVGTSVVILRDSTSRALALLQLAVLPAIVWSRPEGAIVAAIALAPLVLDPRIPLWHRRALLVCGGLSSAVWGSFLAIQPATDERGDLGSSSILLMVIGVALVAAAPLVGLSAVTSRRPQLIGLLGIALWALLGLATLARPEIMTASYAAAWTNLTTGEGAWGPMAAVLTIVTITALIVTSVADRLPISFLIVSLPPVAFLLAFGRAIPYRVGPGDSLARMLVQYLPIMVLCIALAAVGRLRGSRPLERTVAG